MVEGAKDAATKMKRSIDPMDLCAVFSWVEKTGMLVEERDRTFGRLSSCFHYSVVASILWSLTDCSQHPPDGYCHMGSGFFFCAMILGVFGMMGLSIHITALTINTIRHDVMLSVNFFPWVTVISLALTSFVCSLLFAFSQTRSMYYLGMTLSPILIIAWYRKGIGEPPTRFTHMPDHDVRSIMEAFNFEPENTRHDVRLPMESINPELMKPGTIRIRHCQERMQLYTMLVRWVKNQ